VVAIAKEAAEGHHGIGHFPEILSIITEWIEPSFSPSRLYTAVASTLSEDNQSAGLVGCNGLAVLHRHFGSPS
jgi:hypothetical protein